MYKRFENDRTTHNKENRVFKVSPDGVTEEQAAERTKLFQEAEKARLEKNRANARYWASLPFPWAQVIKSMVKLVGTCVLIILAGIGVTTTLGVSNAPKAKLTQTEVVNFKTYVIKQHLKSAEDCQAALAKNNVYAGYEIATWRDTDGNLHPCVVINTVEVSNG